MVSYQGYEYATVQIGGQCWFAENLRSENYKNGDTIPTGLSGSEWASTSSGAVSVYGEGSHSCSSASLDGCDESWSQNQYGRLYNGHAVYDPRGLCPSGWHVSTEVDWTEMLNHLLGDSSTISLASLLKADYGWPQDGNGTNSSGFSALPGGYREDGFFSSEGEFGVWWRPSAAMAANYALIQGADDEVEQLSYILSAGFSVRCVRDAE